MIESKVFQTSITCPDCGWTAEDTILAKSWPDSSFSAAGSYAEHRKDGACPRPAVMPDNLIPVRLVPVNVFGAEQCCEHYPHGVPDGERGCEATGYGLMDSVEAWSDCNRANGHIFRFDNVDPRYRIAGETLTIWVDPEQYKTFSETEW